MFFDLFVFCCIPILISSLIRNRFVSYSLIISSVAIFIFDALSLITTKFHLSNQFINNLTIENFQQSFVIAPAPTIIAIVCVILILYILIKNLSNLTKTLHTIKYTISIPLILLAIGYTTINNDLLNSCKRIIVTFAYEFSTKKDLTETLNDLGAHNFTLNSDIVASKGKNIVIIYLESFEKAFLTRKEFSSTTKNTRELTQTWNTFFNYNSVESTNWTIAALYATQTGLPFIFHNTPIIEKLKTITEPDVPSLYSILKKAGYSQSFFTGSDGNYTSKEQFLYRSGIDKVFEKNNILLDNNLPLSNWGIYDADLFASAKKEFLRLAKSNRPFSLSILTTDLHFPTGHQDIRLKTTFPELTKLRSLSYSVKATDYLLKDFIDFLKHYEEKYNLAIFLLPDHELPPYNTPEHTIINSGERGMWLTTNIRDIPSYENTSANIYCWDIPNIILNSAEVKTNVNFGKNLFYNISPDWILNNQIDISNLNILLNKFN